MPADVHLKQTAGVDPSLPRTSPPHDPTGVDTETDQERSGRLHSLPFFGRATGCRRLPRGAGAFLSYRQRNAQLVWQQLSSLFPSTFRFSTEGEKRLKVRQYNYDYQQTQIRFEQQRKQLDKEYDDTSLQLSHNLEVFRTQQDNYRQAEEVYQVTEEKYREGVASMTELLQDEMRLRNAQSACVQAHCQCNVAQLQLLKLSGNLKELTD